MYVKIYDVYINMNMYINIVKGCIYTYVYKYKICGFLSL